MSTDDVEIVADKPAAGAKAVTSTSRLSVASLTTRTTSSFSSKLGIKKAKVVRELWSKPNRETSDVHRDFVKGLDMQQRSIYSVFTVLEVKGDNVKTSCDMCGSTIKAGSITEVRYHFVGVSPDTPSRLQREPCSMSI